MLVKNDGQAFREEDWQRLKRIAEGNPDETKIGAFGVGFYSVFSDCEGMAGLCDRVVDRKWSFVG